MTAINPSISAQALDNFGSLGFRLRVYALVLPACVAIAVILDVGLGLPISTVAIAGIVISIVLLIVVSIMYTVWQRKGEGNFVADLEFSYSGADLQYAYSMADLRRMQADFIKAYRHFLRQGTEEVPDRVQKLLVDVMQIVQLDDYLHKTDPKTNLIELDKETFEETVLPLEHYLDYLGALVNEYDPEPQRLLEVVTILESLNRTAAERWELEPHASVVYRRALHDIAQAVDVYVMKNFASLRQVRTFRKNYARQHGSSSGFGAIVDSHGVFDPRRQRS